MSSKFTYPTKASEMRWALAQLLENRWWKRYLKTKDKDVYLEWKRSYWRELLLSCPNLPAINSSMRIADLACGPAGIFILFPEHPIIAVDPLIDRYERELLHFSKTDYPNVQFVNSCLEDFKSAYSLDLVFCINAINHTRDIASCLHSIKNCLAEDAILVLSTDVHKHRFLRSVFRWLSWDLLHPQQWTLVEYEQLLNQAGFQIISRKTLRSGWIFNYVLWELKKG